MNFMINGVQEKFSGVGRYGVPLGQKLECADSEISDSRLKSVVKYVADLRFM